VRAKERWRIASGAKLRARKVRVPEVLITYTCDQNATVSVSGVVGIASSRRGHKTTKATAINLAPVSSRAVITATAGVVLALPASTATALSRGVRTSVTVTFKVKNANGIGVGTLKFRLLPRAQK
jgi:hypothetical protein